MWVLPAFFYFCPAVGRYILDRNRQSAAIHTAISGGIEVTSSGIKVVNGEIDRDDFVGNVAKETVGGGLSAAVGSVAATVAATGAATLLATTSAPIWVPAAVGIGAAVAVGSTIKSFWDSIFN